MWTHERTYFVMSVTLSVLSQTLFAASWVEYPRLLLLPAERCYPRVKEQCGDYFALESEAHNSEGTFTLLVNHFLLLASLPPPWGRNGFLIEAIFNNPSQFLTCCFLFKIQIVLRRCLRIRTYKQSFCHVIISRFQQLDLRLDVDEDKPRDMKASYVQSRAIDNVLPAAVLIWSAFRNFPRNLEAWSHLVILMSHLPLPLFLASDYNYAYQIWCEVCMCSLLTYLSEYLVNEQLSLWIHDFPHPNLFHQRRNNRYPV